MQREGLLVAAERLVHLATLVVQHAEVREDLRLDRGRAERRHPCAGLHEILEAGGAVAAHAPRPATRRERAGLQQRIDTGGAGGVERAIEELQVGAEGPARAEHRVDGEERLEGLLRARPRR